MLDPGAQAAAYRRLGFVLPQSDGYGSIQEDFLDRAPVEAASKWPIWQVIQWPSADQMRHLKKFVLSEGAKYRDLIPSDDLLEPNRTGKPNANTGWAYCAATADRSLLLLYFEKDCPVAVLAGARAEAKYLARWFDPRTGQWAGEADVPLRADANGRIPLPGFPGGDWADAPCANDWAMKLIIQAGRQ